MKILQKLSEILTTLTTRFSKANILQAKFFTKIFIQMEESYITEFVSVLIIYVLFSSPLSAKACFIQ